MANTTGPGAHQLETPIQHRPGSEGNTYPRTGRVACGVCGQIRGRDLCAALLSKKTQKTRREDIELARQRFKQIGD